MARSGARSESRPLGLSAGKPSTARLPVAAAAIEYDNFSILGESPSAVAAAGKPSAACLPVAAAAIEYENFSILSESPSAVPAVGKPSTICLLVAAMAIESKNFSILCESPSAVAAAGKPSTACLPVAAVWLQWRLSVRRTRLSVSKITNVRDALTASWIRWKYVDGKAKAARVKIMRWRSRGRLLWLQSRGQRR